MKNWKLSTLLNTPLGVVTVVGLLILTVEFLIMLVIVSMHNVILYDQVMEEIVAGIIDPILLTLIVSPALYFLVFRKIQEGEQRFRQINAAALNAIVIVNEQSRITDWNSAAQKMFQYRPEEAVGQQLHQLIAPSRFHADALRGFAHFEETGEGPVVGKVTEIAARRKDGSEFPVELSISAVKLQGRWHAIGVIRDITERKQAETAFRALVGTTAQNIGAEFFRETVNSLSTWLRVECVIVGELVDENRVRALAMQLDGKAIEHYEYALPGTPCSNVIHKGYCEYSEGICQLFPTDKDLLTMGAEAYVGTPVRNKAGKTIGVLCAISRHKIAPPPMLKGVFEIIAARVGAEIERKQAEEVARINQARFGTIFSQAPLGIALIDSFTGQIYEVNSRFAEIAGRTIEEMTAIDWMSITHPDDIQKGLDNMALLNAGKIPGFSMDKRYIRPDGSIVWINITIAPLRMEKNISPRHLCMIDDITERKQAEAKLAEHTEELRRWHDITMGREMRTLELKREINELLRQAGQPPRYLSVEQSDAAAEGSLRSSGAAPRPTEGRVSGGVPFTGEPTGGVNSAPVSTGSGLPTFGVPLAGE